jgi:aryl-alcohol dehydrogenase-like predicted oxidoreductase
LPDALSSTSTRRAAFEYLDALLELNCNAFDLAASYQIGGTERLFGNWIASRHHRDRLLLISKGGHPYPIIQPNRLTPAQLESDLHASLRRLRTDRVELYLVHRDAPLAALEPVAETMASFVRTGKIGAWGVSNWTHDRIAEMDKITRAAGLPPIVASSPQFSLVDWEKPPWAGCVSISGDRGQQARAYYERTQIQILAWSPLGSGFLSPSVQGRAESRSSRLYGSPANFERKRRAESLALRYHLDPVEIALAYLFEQRFPVAAVVAASTVAKMRVNLHAASLKLSAGDVAWLERGEPAALTGRTR